MTWTGDKRTPGSRLDEESTHFTTQHQIALLLQCITLYFYLIVPIDRSNLDDLLTPTAPY